MSVMRAMSGVSAAEMIRGPFCCEVLSGSYVALIVMFGYFFWNAAISWSSKVFRPAPSHSFSSTFSLLTSVLTGSEFALDFDDDDPGPHAATDARQATAIVPAMRVLTDFPIFIDVPFLAGIDAHSCDAIT